LDVKQGSKEDMCYEEEEQEEQEEERGGGEERDTSQGLSGLVCPSL
jgi:hypothetical protein